MPETIERLGPYKFVQNESGQRLTSDSVLLVDFLLPLKKNDTVIDLGCGSGAIELLLCSKSGVGKVVGVEITEASARIAGKNVEKNGLSNRVEVIIKDWRGLKGVYPPGSFSVVVSNPPYIKKGCGRVSGLKERALARHESAGTLSDLVGISKYLAGKNGRIFYVYPVRRFIELLGLLKRNGLEVRRLKFVRAKKTKAAGIFLVEAKGKGGLETRVESPVSL